jgi:hypothetical protein
VLWVVAVSLDNASSSIFTLFYSRTPLLIQQRLDSGTFSDSLAKRLNPELALMRQPNWEANASKKLWTLLWAGTGIEH